MLVSDKEAEDDQYFEEFGIELVYRPEAVLEIYEWLQTDSEPFRLIWVQITNEQLTDSCRVAVHTHGRIGIRFFDIYRIAAIRMTAKDYKQEGNKQDC